MNDTGFKSGNILGRIKINGIIHMVVDFKRHVNDLDSLSEFMNVISRRPKKSRPCDFCSAYSDGICAIDKKCKSLYKGVSVFFIIPPENYLSINDRYPRIDLEQFSNKICKDVCPYYKPGCYTYNDGDNVCIMMELIKHIT